MGTSLFSLVRVRRFTIMERSLFALLGKFCLDSKQNLESGRGVLKLTKVLAQVEKYDCNCGEWSERLVIRDPATAATKFCTRMARLSMKLCSESWGYSHQIRRGGAGF